MYCLLLYVFVCVCVFMFGSCYYVAAWPYYVIKYSLAVSILQYLPRLLATCHVKQPVKGGVNMHNQRTSIERKDFFVVFSFFSREVEKPNPGRIVSNYCEVTPLGTDRKRRLWQ
jgi:hypothetical protein